MKTFFVETIEYRLIVVFSFIAISVSNVFPQISTYTNPVGGMSNIGDPFVLNYNGNYYMYCTSDNARGFKVWQSSNLVSWTYKGFAYDKQVQNSVWTNSAGNYWAPEVIYYDNYFYMLYSGSAKDGHKKLALARSSSPLGPFMDWEVPVVVNNYSCIDGDILIDDDGIPYLYYSKAASENIINGNQVSQTYVQQLIPHTLIPVGSPVLCLTPSQAWEHPNNSMQWNEGPCTMKHDGIYYLTYSSNAYTTANYAIGYATASSPLGPWNKYSGNPILSSNLSIGASGPGHNGFALSPDSTEWFIVYAAHTDPNNPSANRSLYIDRMYFDNGLLKVYGPTRSPQPVPSTNGNYLTVTPGLVSYYPFNDNVKDAGGSSNNGVVHNAGLTFDRAGIMAKAYYFNGSSSYIEVPSSSNLNVTGGITVTSWIKADTSQPSGLWGRIIDKLDNVGHKGWALSRNPNTNAARFELYDSNGDNHYVETNHKIADNTWHQVSASYDGQVMKIYMDGVLENHLNIGAKALSNTTDSLGIGNNNDGNFFKGTIDECMIYNRALSDAEVKTIYNDGNQSASVPVLLSPTMGTTGVARKVTLKWDTSSYAISYHVQIAKDLVVNSDGSFKVQNVVYDNMLAYTYVQPSQVLDSLTTYYWHVSAINSGGTGGYSVIYNFKTGAKVSSPSTPRLLSPSAYVTGEQRRTVFQWNSSPDADSYRLQIAPDYHIYTSTDSLGAFLSGNVVFDTTLADTTFRLSTPLDSLTRYYWHVGAINSAGMSVYANSPLYFFTTGTEITGIDEEVGKVPTKFALSQNYPNPFNPTTMIKYSIPKSGFVTLKVFNVLGQELVKLVNREQRAGSYEVSFNAEKLSSGVYLYRLQSGKFSMEKKLVLLK